MRISSSAMWIFFLIITICTSALSCDSGDDDDDIAPDDDDDAGDDDTGDDDDDDTAPPLPTPTGKTLSWLGVKDGRIMDEYGRQVLIRGINARIEGLFDVTFDDGRIPLEPIPAFTTTDAEAMAHLGFNFLRLPINWSGVEPHEGEFSETYLAKLNEVVGIANEAGLYVLIDFHQDAYSKEIGEDGAPLWAIIPPPEELLEGPLHDLQERRLSSQVLKAFESFFLNKEGIRDRFMPAWRLVISRHADNPGVAGFEPMNEPVTFHIFDHGLQRMQEFYQAAALEMRKVDDRHSLWLEPESFLRNQLLFAPLLEQPFPDGNVVYEPHLYPRGMSYNSRDEWYGALTKTFGDMVDEAASWDAAVVLGEWGVHPHYDHAEGYIQAVLALIEEHRFGHAFWVWKEISQGNWGFYDFDTETASWILRTGPGMDALVRPTAMAVPGKLFGQSYDSESKTLYVQFEASGGEGPPLLYLPQRHYPQGFTALLNGEGISLETDPETQRSLVDWDGQAGTFVLQVRPAM